MSLRDLIVESWFIVWEKLVSYVPLPRGLADFAVVLIIVTALVAIHRLHRGLFRAILVLLWGVLVVSVIFYLICRVLKILEPRSMRRFVVKKNV
jgi:uncharacterized membrane protein